MTDITELAQRLKAAAEKASPGNWRAFQYHDGRCGVGGGNHDEIMVCEHISKKRPHDALFIALANPANILALVEALESEKRICATWRKTAESTGEKLEKAQTINAAAEKLVRCKGRYHSEQNYRALAALFGVTVPDLPPLETEARTVSVKLPPCVDDLHGIGMVMSADAVTEALSAAGIKVEAE
ncbi:TPA: ead/Ea22-like family protein [Klebsiella pneumoniae]|uniref:ead/Ea22-like family protein n=1 Tax=Klebsiella pneumoniae TaxID=573 RepID=UPI000E3164FC|nr:ead/Ea22-like family protein [Klebsiella pneumoniae]RFD17838.1 ead/Ea22-like family protein [Klebsiella pneumoniae]HBV6573019.1 ead/Ea22-like family protein [Klebsiella pneumoniae]